jgi:(R)-amidase
MLVLLAQLTPEPGALAANAERAAAAIADHPAAELAVFPELYLSGYRTEELGEVGCDADAPELRLVAEACARARTAALVGFVEASELGFANAVAAIDEEGHLAGVYRKAQLFGDERRAFQAGKALAIFELAGRRVAPLVCFDVEFPELARAAALAGAEVLVTVAANMEPFAAEHRLHARARALENRLPHAYVNRGGAESGHTFVGESCAVDAAGEVTAAVAGAADELLLAELGAAGTGDERVDYLAFDPTRLPVDVHEKTQSRGGIR